MRYGQFVGAEFALETSQHAPFEVGQLDEVGVGDVGKGIGLGAGFHTAAADVADAENEEFPRGHEAVTGGADLG